MEKNQNETSGENTVSYAQLYLMTVNVVKSVMLLIASLGPRTTASLVASTCTASFIMGSMTISWFHVSEVKSHTEIQPASMAFVNVWKTSSYFSSVVTALLVVAAHSAGSSKFPESSLTAALVISWSFVILAFFYYYRFWSAKHGDFLKSEKLLIEYPFNSKHTYDSLGLKQEFLLSRSHLRDNLHLPGFTMTPWHDHTSANSNGNAALISSLVVDISYEINHAASSA